jgi:hypothetical protein
MYITSFLPEYAPSSNNMRHEGMNEVVSHVHDICTIWGIHYSDSEIEDMMPYAGKTRRIFLADNTELVILNIGTV